MDFAEKYLDPRASGELIARLSDHVKINMGGIENTAQMVYSALLDGSIADDIEWDKHEMHYRGDESNTVQWCFIANTVNFSFWTPPLEGEQFTVTYRGRKWSGYVALCACINRAIEQGYKMLDAKFLAKLTIEQANQIFQGDTCIIPMAEQRVQALNEAGKVLLEKFDGLFYECVKLCDKSALKLLDIVAKNFESYRDIGKYKGNNVSFLKRAQIVVSDIYACLNGRGLGEFRDISSLTMFADYRVPQVLVFTGALSYSQHLYDLLEKGAHMDYDDQTRSINNDIECEIRGCSIHACELIVASTKRLITTNGKSIDRQVTASMVDKFLWCYRRKHAQKLQTVPFHRVRSIFY